MSSQFNWLHLTDLHFGLAGQEQLWPNIRQAFFEDLGRLHEQTGPWDAVLFTGDFVQRGAAAEYIRLNEEVLDPLWNHLKTLGSGEAVLLAVPGNHDLTRPAIGRKATPAEKFLLKPELFSEVSEEFWTDVDSDYRLVVSTAFANFIEWRERCLIPQPTLSDGLLPGDFAVSLTTNDKQRSIGVLGLNTTFLQLKEGDYRSKLVCDVRQFHAPCRNDGPGWVAEHDVCLLLTHQGPDWLDKGSQTSVYPEINPAGRFAVHLFGHEHENNGSETVQNGGEVLRKWQGPSLFSREPWGDQQRIERRHGYSAGSITFVDKAGASIRKWPRIGIDRKVNGWKFDRDTNATLEGDGGEKAQPIALRQRKPSTAVSKSTSELTRRQDQLLRAYREAALKLVDIVDLANLPEDERQIAMQRFALRQLYIPLRLTVATPSRDKRVADDDKTLISWEQQREQARLNAAGRVVGDGPATESNERLSLGELLASPGAGRSKKRRGRGRKAPPEKVVDHHGKRIVILGDPGGGKTTLLRWLATAWLLRAERPQDVDKLPDVASLPRDERLPILVRCRQLERDGLGSCTLADILLQTLRPMELKLPNNELPALVEVLMEQLEAGRAAMLVDGLDEITDPQLRARFCDRLETIAEQYGQSHLIATSRVVGYREMPRRLGRGFQHATLAGLTADDKDDFVRRWCDAVERDPKRRKDEAGKLLAGIHDPTSRIERLTGNPMLLTTMALVQRKVGRLPPKRHKLYEEAVDLLLRWRSDVDEPMDADEAWPQLEYVAWAMCERGVQRLRRDELLDLLVSVRRDHPNIRPLEKHSPEEFLKRVESRTGLLVEVGSVRHNGLEEPVFEFRHLTFQEYLAAIALIRGHFPRHDPKRSLAERVTPLAGTIERVKNVLGDHEQQVTENWREALRLCVAACNDDDVDATLRAILGAEGEVLVDQRRPRAILAALCLADEPNASITVIQEVCRRFAESVAGEDGIGVINTGLDRAALEVARSSVAESLELVLTEEFMRRAPNERASTGALAGMIAVRRAAGWEGELDSVTQSRIAWIQAQTSRLSDPDDRISISAAMAVMVASFERKSILVPGLINALYAMISRGPAAAAAACWALWWLANHRGSPQKPQWQPSDAELARLTELLHSASKPQVDTDGLRYLCYLFEDVPSADAVPSLIGLLAHEDTRTRRAAIDALNSSKDPRAIAALIGRLGADDDDERTKALGALASIRGDETDLRLLSRDSDARDPWLDPRVAIDDERVQGSATVLKLPAHEIRRRYKTLAAEYGLICNFATE